MSLKLSSFTSFHRRSMQSISTPNIWLVKIILPHSNKVLKIYDGQWREKNWSSMVSIEWKMKCKYELEFIEECFTLFEWSSIQYIAYSSSFYEYSNWLDSRSNDVGCCRWKMFPVSQFNRFRKDARIYVVVKLQSMAAYSILCTLQIFTQITTDVLDSVGTLKTSNLRIYRPKICSQNCVVFFIYSQTYVWNSNKWNAFSSCNRMYVECTKYTCAAHAIHSVNWKIQPLFLFCFQVSIQDMHTEADGEAWVTRLM